MQTVHVHQQSSPVQWEESAKKKKKWKTCVGEQWSWKVAKKKRLEPDKGNGTTIYICLPAS